MPERKKWIKPAVIVISIYGVFSAVVLKDWVYLPFAVILILATFSERKQIVSEEGVDIQYTVVGTAFHNMWRWDEIKTIHTDFLKSRPKVELHFGKDVTARRFVFTEEDAGKILVLAEKMNSNIYVAEIEHK